VFVAVDEGLRGAFLRAVMVVLNEAGWVDVGSLHRAQETWRLLIKHIRPQSTLTGAHTLANHVHDDDHCELFRALKPLTLTLTLSLCLPHVAQLPC
jgi:hypothetical protein